MQIFQNLFLIDFVDPVVLPRLQNMGANSIYNVGQWNAAQPDHRVNRVGGAQHQVHQAEQLQQKWLGLDIILHTKKLNLVGALKENAPCYFNNFRCYRVNAVADIKKAVKADG